ncbi:MAG: hypothetical protein D8M61_02800 [Ignavibacteriae bacterium]|nr:hypothetical protein [Ignavibacteriota bacterium]
MIIKIYIYKKLTHITKAKQQCRSGTVNLRISKWCKRKRWRFEQLVISDLLFYSSQIFNF